MYVDKLDGRIDAGFFDRMAAQWRDEQARCLRDIERHQNANQSYLDEGIHLLELAGPRDACSSGRKRAKSAVCSISWFRTAPGRVGELAVELRQPFDMLAKAKAASAAAEDTLCADSGQI